MTASEKKKSTSIRVPGQERFWPFGFHMLWKPEGQSLPVASVWTAHLAEISPAAEELFGRRAAMDELAEIRAEVEELRARVEAILEKAEAEVASCRDIPRKQAKAEVLDYFTSAATEGVGPQYPSDCAHALNLDAMLVTELCDELESEGLLK